MGTPVDPVPELIRDALAAVSDLPGYPLTHGTPDLRATVLAALERRHGVTGLDPSAALPTIGSKELVAWLPTLLRLGPGDVVAFPALSYPTYEVGVRLAGATPVRLRDDEPAPAGTRLRWLNSPSNPTGAVLPVSSLASLADQARSLGAVVASDECYLDLGGTARSESSEPRSVLHPEVCGGSFEGLLAVHSLSKSSNLAGYRAGFIAGDASLISALLEVRKHAGMIVPRPVQSAMVAALGNDDHVALQRSRYAARREVLRPAVEAAGFTVHHSQAGIYLWCTAGEPGRRSVDRLAEAGILVAPGEFYGPDGTDFVRVALTATDDRIKAAAARLSAL